MCGCGGSHKKQRQEKLTVEQWRAANPGGEVVYDPEWYKQMDGYLKVTVIPCPLCGALFDTASESCVCDSPPSKEIPAHDIETVEEYQRRAGEMMVKHALSGKPAVLASSLSWGED